MRAFGILFLMGWALLGATTVSAQQVINGSFEDAGLDCRIGLSNGGFMSHVRNIKAFGYLEKIDLMTSDCGSGSAQEGRYFLGLHIDADFRQPSILGLELSKPLVAGNTYTLSYYHRLGSRLSEINILQIGVADTLRQFGFPVHEFKGTQEAWTKEEFQFVAPVNGIYITIKLKLGFPTKLFLDNFTLECPTELSIGADTILCKVEQLSFEPLGAYDRYNWSDGSTDSLLTVYQPGTYWLEAQRENCVLSDTVRVEEYEFNCECPLYVPNAFSPNGDGVNDVFRPVSPCEIAWYEFAVYNRWGQSVFVSTNPNEAWGGEGLPATEPQGPYPYVLRFRFRYDTETRYRRGGITLVR